MRKSELRARLRSRRRQLAPAFAREVAQQIAAHLASTHLWHSPVQLAAYLSGDGEVDTSVLLHRARTAGHGLHLPRLTGDSLEFVPWSDEAPLQPNRYGIGEPSGAAHPPSALDLILLPTVGWTLTGSRLGMGGGYYDRSLAAMPALDIGDRPLLVGLAYACQRVEEDFAQPWDVRLDAILTEDGLQVLNAAAEAAL